MRVSKRDFLKMIGVGTGAGVALAKIGTPPKSIEPVLVDIQGGAENPSMATLANSRDSWYDAVDAILYDRVTFPPGSELPAYFSMFSTPAGAICPYDGHLKGEQDTNLYTPCNLPAPACFWIKRIHIAVSPDASEYDVKLARNYSWSLFLCEKRYAGGPCVLDLQRASLTDIFKRKVPTKRHSLEFNQTKGLFIPSMYHFRQQFLTTRSPEHNRLVTDRAGKGLEFITAFEGVQWRACQ